MKRHAGWIALLAGAIASVVMVVEAQQRWPNPPIPKGAKAAPVIKCQGGRT